MAGWPTRWTVNPGAKVRLLDATGLKTVFFSSVLSEPTLVQTRKCPSRLRLHSRPTKVAAHVKDPMSTFLQRLVAYIDTYRQRINVTD